VIDHIEAAIAQLEAAKNAVQGMYLDTCSETFDQDVLTIAGNGGSRFLLMIQMLDQRIEALNAILEGLQIFG